MQHVMGVEVQSQSIGETERNTDHVGIKVSSNRDYSWTLFPTFYLNLNLTLRPPEMDLEVVLLKLSLGTMTHSLLFIICASHLFGLSGTSDQAQFAETGRVQSYTQN